MDAEEYNTLLERKRQMDLKRKQRKAQEAKERLEEDVKKRMKTCFVGALNSVEDHLSFLWEARPDEEDSELQEEMQEIYQKLRKEIFDKGNQQIREFKGDLSKYEVNSKQYKLELKFNKGEE